ncbi:MAG: PAS domain-containing protein [Deltaproteobacteria bacterium]|nr:MAG: PAS domain-containing protein [Deltaproteobacteria bacterium]
MTTPATPPYPAGDPALAALVFDNIDRGVIALDREGRITLFNPAAESYLDRAARHILGRHYTELFVGQEPLLYLVNAALRDGRSITDDESIFLPRPKAPPLPVSVYAAPIFSKRGDQDGAVLIIRDLSRVRELEDTLRRADQLAMLATLAAGLAHEIKNPLGGIKGAAQLLTLELQPDSPLREYTRVMIKETERINGIIEELMDLGKPRPAIMGEVSIGRILDDIVLLQREAARGQNIDFALSLDPSIPPVHGDESLLTRLFLNLVKNAREAVDRDGRVEIECKISAEYHMTTPGHRPSPLVVVRIRDTGCGIPPDELERIFTPYYTTKSRGSGLGLAICQKIVEDHRGFLKVASIPGEGTEFSVWLPLR